MLSEVDTLEPTGLVVVLVSVKGSIVFVMFLSMMWFIVVPKV